MAPPAARAARAALIAVLIAVLGAGCSARISVDAALDAEELAAQLDPQLQQLKGEHAEVTDLTCDGELAADVGAEQRCHFTDVFGDRYGLTVTTTAVDGDELTYDLTVDPGQTVDPDELEPKLVTQLSTISGGIPPDDVTCPEALPGVVGESITCVLTAGSDRLETEVTVTAADGPDVRYEAQVADEALP